MTTLERMLTESSMMRRIDWMLRPGFTEGVNVDGVDASIDKGTPGGSKRGCFTVSACPPRH
jgi:hypothetical protein